MMTMSTFKHLVPGARGSCLVVLLTACASSPQWPSYNIYTVQDTVDLLRSPDAVRLHLTAVIRNTGTKDLYVSGCMPVAQRRVDSAWYSIFPAPCLNGNSLRVSPGDSALFDVRELRSTFDNDPNPELVGAGWYRLIFSVGYSREAPVIIWSGLTNSGVSSPFFVRDSSPST